MKVAFYPYNLYIFKSLMCEGFQRYFAHFSKVILLKYINFIYKSFNLYDDMKERVFQKTNLHLLFIYLLDISFLFIFNQNHLFILIAISLDRSIVRYCSSVVGKLVDSLAPSITTILVSGKQVGII